MRAKYAARATASQELTFAFHGTGSARDGTLSETYGSGATLGAVWGAVWWVLGGLILMPLFLGMPLFAPLRMAPMRPVAMRSLVGHLIYGIIAGLVYARIRRGAETEASARARVV